jgi:hypothetical protein
MRELYLFLVFIVNIYRFISSYYENITFVIDMPLLHNYSIIHMCLIVKKSTLYCSHSKQKSVFLSGHKYKIVFNLQKVQQTFADNNLLVMFQCVLLCGARTNLWCSNKIQACYMLQLPLYTWCDPPVAAFQSYMLQILVFIGMNRGNNIYPPSA